MISQHFPAAEIRAATTAPARMLLVPKNINSKQSRNYINVFAECLNTLSIINDRHNYCFTDSWDGLSNEDRLVAQQCSW